MGIFCQPVIRMGDENDASSIFLPRKLSIIRTGATESSATMKDPFLRVPSSTMSVAEIPLLGLRLDSMTTPSAGFVLSPLSSASSATRSIISSSSGTPAPDFAEILIQGTSPPYPSI